MTIETIPLSFRAEKRLMKELDNVAEQDTRSRSQVIQIAIKEFLDRQKNGSN